MQLSPLLSDRLIAVMPHPDDEAYVAAATLLAAVERRAEVTVLCVTRGEAGGDPATRERELRESCRLLGVQALEIWSLPDGDLRSCDEEEVVERLVQWLNGVPRSCILGLGADGVYGHIDHLTLHRWLRRSVRSCEPSHRLWESVMPPRWFHPLWRRLRRARPELVAHGWRPEDFGDARAQADVAVKLDERTQRLKGEAIRCHASQLLSAAPEDFLMPGLMTPLFEQERWRAVDETTS